MSSFVAFSTASLFRNRKYPIMSKHKPKMMKPADIQYWILGRVFTTKSTVSTMTGVISFRYCEWIGVNIQQLEKMNIRVAYVFQPKHRYHHVGESRNVSLEASQILGDDVCLRCRTLVERHAHYRLDDYVTLMFALIRLQTLQPIGVRSGTRAEVRSWRNNRLI